MPFSINKAEKIYQKSIGVLEGVQLENGGCLASPPGKRYPYVYPRDHAVCTLAFIDLGFYDRARKALEFVFRAQLPDGAFPQRYDQNGKDASYKPIQIDGNGQILYALGKYVKASKDYDFIRNNWEKIKRCVDYILAHSHNERTLVYSPNSIHEFPPFEAGYEIWANSTCYGGVREAVYCADKIKKIHHKVLWDDFTKELKKSMLKYMWNSRVKGFIKNIRLNESSSVETDVDASAYAVADYNVLNDKDKRVRLTVKRIMDGLWHKELGGVCRYAKYEGRNNAGWGPWPHFTLMIARHFIRTGNRKMSDKLMKWVIDISYDDLLPEHIATKKEFNEVLIDYTESGILRPDRKVMFDNIKKHPTWKKGMAYAVLPLAWPHAEFIRTYRFYKSKFKI